MKTTYTIWKTRIIKLWNPRSIWRKNRKKIVNKIWFITEELKKLNMPKYRVVYAKVFLLRLSYNIANNFCHGFAWSGRIWILISNCIVKTRWSLGSVCTFTSSVTSRYNNRPLQIVSRSSNFTSYPWVFGYPK